MYAKKLSDFIVHEDDDIRDAYWRFSARGGVSIVCNDDDKFIGVIGQTDWNKILHATNPDKVVVRDVVNKKCTTIGVEDTYSKARDIYADKAIEYIPVISEEGDVIDLFTRQRAFYKKYFEEGKLPKMNYAIMLYAGAIQAKNLGYKAISAIEFGVAGGNGLLAMQFHAREISRLIGIEIQVYGFDTGSGLPTYDVNYLDMPFHWKQGLFEMDFSDLEKKLETTKLVIGKIEDTLPSFFDIYNSAPVGVIAVDVDLYTATLPILSMMENGKTECFTPRIYMYFDDIFSGYECLGENVAIKEFNERNKGRMNICPEGKNSGLSWELFHGINYHKQGQYDNNIKICHMFHHPDYNKFIRTAPSNYPIRNYSRFV